MNPVRKDMEVLSNSMATYAHIKANMESFALYFMVGVCSGLLLALVLLILGIVCRPRTKTPPSSPDKRRLKESSEQEEEEKEDENNEEVDDDVEMPAVTVSPMNDQSQLDGTSRSVNVFTSAEELERARRLEERERIVREIWRNGQPDILITGTGTLSRVHYH